MTRFARLTASTIVALVLAIIQTGNLSAQAVRHALTDADVVDMSQSGLAEETIILAIQQSPSNFDTSPDALIELKKEGVSDSVLNAMLSAPSAAAPTAGGSQQDCAQVLDGALATLGSPEKVSAVRSLGWTGLSTVTSASGQTTSNVEHLTVFPSSIYFSLQKPNGLIEKFVIAPEFNYFTSGKMTASIPVATLEELQNGLKLEPIYVAQHRDQYSCIVQGDEQIGSFHTTKIKISGEGVEGLWNIGSATGQIMRVTRMLAGSDASVTDFSDLRQVDGIFVYFVRHTIKGGVTTDVTVSDYKVNPETDASLFQVPADRPSPALTFKVLQSESVPYIVQTGGGISTSCQISGSSTESVYANTTGNSTYGTGTGTEDLRMNCNSYDNTIRWEHVLNAMLVQASDGNAYIIACDRAWRWSKCTPLRAGDTFLAQRTDKGFLVQKLNGKSGEDDATYGVLQSRSLHP